MAGRDHTDGGTPAVAHSLRFRAASVATRAPANLASVPANPLLERDHAAGPAADRPAARPSRRWKKLLLIVPFALFLVFLTVGGYYALRLRDVFSTLNAVSTPAAVISGDALGGSGDIRIDTAPARTALAGGGGGGSAPAAAPVTDPAGEGGAPAPAAETPDDPAAAAPEEGATLDEAERVAGASGPQAAEQGAAAAPEAPGEPETQSADPAPAAPEPTVGIEPAPAVVEREGTPEIELDSEPRRVILSELERIKNGGFEKGDEGWYFEEGASVTSNQARTGANALELWEDAVYVDQGIFFVPGTAYQVSGWGKLLEAGSYADFGVVYWDEEGNRLPDLEPPDLQFTEPIWKKLTFTFTPPAEADVVKIFIWKPENGTRFWADDISVRSIVPEEALTTTVTASTEGITTILVMGVDAREGEAIDIGVRPDSLAVVQLNAETGSCRLLSIPRDTRSELPGYGMSKINHALAVGGIAYQQQVVEGLLSLEIDHYVLIDFNGFEDLVNAVGGITVDVPSDFVSSDGTRFVAGIQEMDGKLALSYARWRGGPDGDFGRIERQQQILRALVAKATNLNIVRSVNELLPAVERNLRTDLSPSEIVAIGSDFQSRCTAETVSMISLEGTPATYDDPLLQLPLYYIEVDQAEIRAKVAALLEP